MNPFFLSCHHCKWSNLLMVKRDRRTSISRSFHIINCLLLLFLIITPRFDFRIVINSLHPVPQLPLIITYGIYLVVFTFDLCNPFTRPQTNIDVLFYIVLVSFYNNLPLLLNPSTSTSLMNVQNEFIYRTSQSSWQFNAHQIWKHVSTSSQR